MNGASVPLVLVVDDDARNREVVAGYLESSSRIIEAESGQKALELLGRERVDLVILDVMMPGLSGFDVCRAIRGAPREDYLPVLILTALGDRQNRLEGLKAGADDFLSKPVDGAELRLRAQTFLRLRAQDLALRARLSELYVLQHLKEDLFATIVHDLRNPLTGIQGYLQILRAEVGDHATLATDLDKLMASAAKLGEGLEDILRVRLLEEGELKPDRTPVPLGRVAIDAAATVEGAARERKVSLEVAATTDPTLPLDAKLVRRAIENLLSNAIKYAPRGSAVSLATAGSADGAVVEVADRGPGIPDSLKDALFKKFGSVEARAGQVRRGFGLGLYFVKLVAEAHGGAVAVRDREGGGTVFTVRLPGAASGAAAPAGGSSAAST
ncbi:MAG TPA: hybrid sensor histidine kinase/response regulator [Planctomycetota bacterium]|nr:hybrid sensor histidine kinase/response regulator [Planctomycetota bacterium]